MSSWHYSYLFPETAKQLSPERAIQVLQQQGLVFDNEIIPLSIHDDGHVDESGLPMKIDKSVKQNLIQRLTLCEQLQVICRNKELYFSCSFCTQVNNPYICFCWSKKLFSYFDAKKRDEYLKMIRKAAKVTCACYIIFVVDPPDYFEDRFLDIDGIRYIDIFKPDGTTYEIEQIWVDNDVKLPFGVELNSLGPIGDGFFAYSIAI